MTADHPVGIFDSGLGGLSVAREIRLRLPSEHLLYIADSAYCPYGPRPLEEIRARSFAITRALIDAGSKIIVVACNTASGAALDQLRADFDIPFVGVEPAVKPAATSTKSGTIAVLATPATLKTDRFNRLLDNHSPGVDVIEIACPGFVELVEAGEVSGERTLGSIREVLAPLSGSGVDRIVLGCTHYPFLRAGIAEVMGEGVEILDSGAAVARQVERVLAARSLLRESGPGSFTFRTTGEPEEVGPIVARLWGEEVRIDRIAA